MPGLWFGLFWHPVRNNTSAGQSLLHCRVSGPVAASEKEKIMKILSVDPGEWTGVVYAEFTPSDHNQAWLEDIKPLWWKEVSPLTRQGWLTDTWHEMKNGEIDHVVCEDYIISTGRRAMKHHPDSLHVIGALKFMCEFHNIPLTLQSPGEYVVEFATPTKMSAFRGFIKGARDDDALSALRHLIYWVGMR